MPAITFLIGFLLVLVGIGGYGIAHSQGHASPTALIPSIIGGLILLCAILAIFKESLRKHAMHAALLIAVLGMLGTVMGVIKLITLITSGSVDRPLAAVSQTVTFVLCLAFVIFGVRSFIAARRARSQETA